MLDRFLWKFALFLVAVGSGAVATWFFIAFPNTLVFIYR